MVRLLLSERHSLNFTTVPYFISAVPAVASFPIVLGLTEPLLGISIYHIYRLYVDFSRDAPVGLVLSSVS